MRTLVRAAGANQKLEFYQTQGAGQWRPKATHNTPHDYEIEADRWNTIENGMSMGPGQTLTGPEIFTNGQHTKYQEFLYRIGRTRSNTAEPGFDNETDRAPLLGSGRSFTIYKIINEHFWMSTADNMGPDGNPDNRPKPSGHLNLHVVRQNNSNVDTHKTHNVSQGLLRVLQRVMAAGVMSELYRQMQEVSLFCFVNNALPRIEAHLYENIDRFHTVEEVVALAERFEVGRNGGAIAKFSISAFQDHMNYNILNDYEGNNHQDRSLSAQMAEHTQDKLNHHYGDQGYDGQTNAINRNCRRGGRRNTRPWGRGRGSNGGGGLRFPVPTNPTRAGGLGHYNDANDPAAAKQNLLCYRCGSSIHIVKDCSYPPVSANYPKHFTARGRGKFKTFQRRERFNAMGVFMGTEDVPVYYDSEKDRIEEIPDVSHVQPTIMKTPKKSTW